MTEDIKVGEKIKAIREEKSLTIEDMSTLIGLSSADVLQIENQMVSPSLGTLIKLAKALNVSMSHLFSEQTAEPFCLVRAAERKIISRFASTEGKSYGYAYESLGYCKEDGKMEPFIVTLNPPDVAEVEPNYHTGEEFIFVLEGEVEVKLDEHTDVLQPGDSIYYEANIPHIVACHGGKEAKILAVIWPGEEMMIF